MMFGQLGLISDPNIHLYCSDAHAYKTYLVYGLVNTDVRLLSFAYGACVERNKC